MVDEWIGGRREENLNPCRNALNMVVLKFKMNHGREPEIRFMSELEWPCSVSFSTSQWSFEDEKESWKTMSCSRVQTWRLITNLQVKSVSMFLYLSSFFLSLSVTLTGLCLQSNGEVFREKLKPSQAGKKRLWNGLNPPSGSECRNQTKTQQVDRKLSSEVGKISSLLWHVCNAGLPR